jgi:hypothetical protein
MLDMSQLPDYRRLEFSHVFNTYNETANVGVLEILDISSGKYLKNNIEQSDL